MCGKKKNISIMNESEQRIDWKPSEALSFGARNKSSKFWYDLFKCYATTSAEYLHRFANSIANCKFRTKDFKLRLHVCKLLFTTYVTILFRTSNQLLIFVIMSFNLVWEMLRSLIWKIIFMLIFVITNCTE